MLGQLLRQKLRGLRHGGIPWTGWGDGSLGMGMGRLPENI
ncbi:hypothetical protein EIKCOROL_00524 [Eikenella corrodens ATCC 23834]|uniref:Uncharacterized protein n=1 Tax=Eikenella corrodens ATCC 23834 TaxID=546274 RepID=C0DT46_EIKCO|nr:hypothetical protein EIKCOROL_00524 [Eikenella corrodens ATCC 23834]